MLCGSAFKNKGVQAMLDAVIALPAGAGRQAAGQGRSR
jgi:translation elongation factor EF-G